MRTSVVARNAMKTMDRRRAARLARREVIWIACSETFGGSGRETLTRRGRGRVRDEDPVQRPAAKRLEDDAGAAGDAGERVVRDVDRHLRRVGGPAVQPGEERPAAGE